MISFEETTQVLTDVTLFGYQTHPSSSNKRTPNKKVKVWSRKSIISEQTLERKVKVWSRKSIISEQTLERKVTIWSRRSVSSDFAHWYNTTLITIRVARNDCVNTTCFKLWFTFLSESQTPVQLASGQWNCSVSHYSRLIHHHMSCNLKAECQDGRDETGACAFSSTRCGGRIALCGRCYSIADSLKGFLGEHTEINKRAAAHCNSRGGRLSLPRCVSSDWHSIIQSKWRFHPKRFKYVWTGLYTDDQSLPNMYIRSLVHEDRTVFHHSVTFSPGSTVQAKKCLHTVEFGVLGKLCESGRARQSYLHSSSFCEFTENDSEKQPDNSKGISLNCTEFGQSKELRSLMKCTVGQLTHPFFVCDSEPGKLCGQYQLSECTLLEPFSDALDSSIQQQLYETHTKFSCSDDTIVVSYTLVCDFIQDCPDHSDESFCSHPPCINMFTCTNGQCLSFSQVCDYTFHCQDKSDENDCDRFRLSLHKIKKAIPSPVLVSFDGVRYFVSTPLSSNESCPASHYHCPGAFSDCLPVYTRCNGLYDCLGQQDEQGCEEALCPGLFRCRLSPQCLHSDHLCDGWPHCPMNEDETACALTCPSGCLCQGHSFLCSRPFSAQPFAQLRSLDATGSAMTLSDLGDNGLLVVVLLARCSLTEVPPVPLLNLRRLDLSHNRLQHVNLSCFLAMPSLQVLLLSHNPLTSLSTDPLSTGQHGSLTELQLSHVSLPMLDTGTLSLFPGLLRLNLTFSAIHTVSSAGFHSTPLLTELHAEGSPLTTFPPTLFQGLARLRWLSSDNYKLCCSEILPANFNRLACLAPRDEISSCRDLLRWWTYRGFLWLMAALAVTGNVFSFAARALLGTVASSGFSVLVSSLGLADLLMGVYVAIIGAADRHFWGRYLHNDDRWKSSALCGAAGCVSLVSSEVSALTIAFITLDRFLVLRFPFSGLRFSPQAAALTCAQTWLLGWLLALVPLLPATRHWRFYSQTGICIPLPVTRRHFAGKPYSVSVLILLNFLLFLLVSAGQAAIYRSIRSNRMTTGSSTRACRDVTIARRLIAVAVTDFLCWFPIGVCGMLSLAGVAVPGEVSVALAIFVLPLNSAINPWIYTLNSMADRRRKSREATFLKLLASQLEFAGELHAN